MKLLEKWMNEYEEQVYNKLIRTQQLVRLWNKAKTESRTLEVNGYNKDTSVEIPEMKNCCCWKIAPNWRRETLTVENTVVTFIVESLEVEGKMYDNIRYKENDSWRLNSYYSYQNKLAELDGFSKLLKQNGCSMSDVNWLASGRSEQDIRTKAHKAMLTQKAAIEAKVKKICGNELTHIDELGAEIFAKGSNNRVAHIWAIGAGGYNIQCYHTRVLVKEVK